MTPAQLSLLALVVDGVEEPTWGTPADLHEIALLSRGVSS